MGWSIFPGIVIGFAGGATFAALGAIAIPIAETFPVAIAIAISLRTIGAGTPIPIAIAVAIEFRAITAAALGARAVLGMAMGALRAGTLTLGLLILLQLLLLTLLFGNQFFDFDGFQFQLRGHFFHNGLFQKIKDGLYLEGEIDAKRQGCGREGQSDIHHCAFHSCFLFLLMMRPAQGSYCFGSGTPPAMRLGCCVQARRRSLAGG